MRIAAALATSARRDGAPSDSGALTFVTLRVYASCTQACGTTGATSRPRANKMSMGEGEGGEEEERRKEILALSSSSSSPCTSLT